MVLRVFNMSDELVFSYFFPPSNDVAGLVLSKRLISENRHVDVVQSKDGALDLDFGKCIDEIVDNRIQIDANCDANYPKCVFKFIRKAKQELKTMDKKYSTITSIVWPIVNHFLALEYKFMHPDVFWNAEFSDPILYDTNNEKRERKLNHEKYINKLNNKITRFNEKNGKNFDLITNPSDMFYLVEYLTFIFADNIVFNNPNQREMMLNKFDENIKSFVLDKSEVKHYPPLPEKYYHIKEFKEDLNENEIHIGYFGNYYSKRHFESVFSAFEILNHKYKSKLKFHFYISNHEFLKEITQDLEISENLVLKNTIDYLDFLNLIKKFDVLMVNDIITEDCYDFNPYIPSKYFDYLGSGRDIWTISEKNSVLSTKDAKYKSNIQDFKTNYDALIKILEDNGYVDDDYSMKDINKYYEKRITNLNKIIESEYTQHINCKNKLKIQGEQEKIEPEEKFSKRLKKIIKR